MYAAASAAIVSATFLLPRKSVAGWSEASAGRPPERVDGGRRGDQQDGQQDRRQRLDHARQLAGRPVRDLL
ncbi:hypothetical protein C463_02903 [Halorubrum californiense DSM 19288]|uniref:Uncharacterized protein n=1 Tax=Halorubrum californiense DSM 19288 TaxID=1227465 RepID=M0EK16_9EURY|nr:hypothetical protein C463_02903 [Halorubrum californiense DSM 19288]